MNCEEFRTAALAGDESPATLDHVASCPSCRAQAEDLRAAHLALANDVLWEEPAPELEAQVQSLIATAAGHDRSYGHRPNRRWVALAGVAAVLVLLLGGIALFRAPSPDWEVALPATDLAPDAMGSVQGWNEDGGTRMLVAIDGLAPAPQGFVYEFWLSDGPVHISAGTFRSAGEVELWSGVERSDFPRLWITLEPIDEDESPSGETVLDTGSV